MNLTKGCIRHLYFTVWRYKIFCFFLAQCNCYYALKELNLQNAKQWQCKTCCVMVVSKDSHNFQNTLKVLSATFFLVCFSRLKESLFETRKNVYFTSKANVFISLSFSRKSNCRILDIQVSWPHQMPEHKTRNTFYWITWEVITVC